LDEMFTRPQSYCYDVKGMNSRKCSSQGLPRFVESIMALGGLVISSPFLILSAILIRATSPGPILFKQIRVGLYGKPFELIKFRSMHIKSKGAQVTAKGDYRVTRVGLVLRKTKLDEIPELWNVVRGDLSLVGPRPEVPKYVDLENPLWCRVLKVRPGITDPITMKLRNEEELLAQQFDPEGYYIRILQPFKLKGYVDYLEQRTALTDFRIIFETLIAILVPFRTLNPEFESEARRH